MKEIFADSFYYIALLNPNDEYHGEAMQVTKSFDSPIVTTMWVLMEVADALSSPQLRLRTCGLLQNILSDANITLILNSDPWFARGLALYGNRSDKDWFLTDCISFEVMNERGINDALTGAHHFSQAGFNPVLKKSNP